MPYKAAKRKTCEAIHCCISIFAVLCVISAVASIVFGVLVAKPGILALDFKDATCIVRSWRFLSNATCDCSGIRSANPNCQSKFPCVQIMVSYEPRRQIIRLNESENFFKNSVVLRETEADFSSKYSQCSFHNCHPEWAQNKLDVEGFRQKFGKPNSFYPCEYNPYREDQVIVSRRFTTTEVLLALVLPTAIFLLCVIVLTCICVIRCKRTQKKKSQRPIHNPFDVPRRYMGRDMPAFEPDEAVDNMNKLPDPFATINDMFSDAGEPDPENTKKRTSEDSTHSQTREISEEPSSGVVPQDAQMSTAM